MRVIEVYYDSNEGLVALDFYYHKNGRPVLNNKITGDRVKVLLDRISNNKDIKARRFVDGAFESIIYDDVCVKIYNYQFIKKYCLLQDYMDKVDSYIRKKKKSVASRVKRKNKYSGKKILVGAAALIMLLYAGSIILNSKSDTLDSSVNNNPVVSVNDVVEQTEVDKIKDMLILMGEETDILSGKYDDNYVQENTKEEINQNYIYIEYEDQSESDKTKKTRELYGDLLEKYANMYGLDSDLVIALATQERGIHSEVMDRGGATGLMQIQNGVWEDYDLTVYNFELGKNETIHITKQKLSECESNIKIGCMILQDCMKRCDYNILLGLQAYNMGPNGVRKAVSKYADDLGCTKEDIICNVNDCGWLNYRDGIAGDSLYVEHVLSYVGSEAQICVYKSDGTKVECFVQNYEHVKTH